MLRSDISPSRKAEVRGSPRYCRIHTPRRLAEDRQGPADSRDGPTSRTSFGIPRCGSKYVGGLLKPNRSKSVLLYSTWFSAEHDLTRFSSPSGSGACSTPSSQSFSRVRSDTLSGVLPGGGISCLKDVPDAFPVRQARGCEGQLAERRPGPASPWPMYLYGSSRNVRPALTESRP